MTFSLYKNLKPNQSGDFYLFFIKEWFLFQSQLENQLLFIFFKTLLEHSLANNSNSLGIKGNVLLMNDPVLVMNAIVAK